MEKIRCKNCGGIIAMKDGNVDFSSLTKDGGVISIKCVRRMPNGKRCHTVNILGEDPKDSKELSRNCRESEENRCKS